MEKFMKYLMYLVLGVFISINSVGCGKNKIDEAAQNQTVIYSDALAPNPAAESVLEKEFAKSRTPWNAKRLVTINKSRNAIDAMGVYLKARLEFDSTLPYYTYKSSFEYFQNQYNILQRELDARILIKGALSEQGQVIYFYVRRDINERLRIQRLRISSAEKTIEANASKDSIAEFKQIFTAVKPLIDMVL